MDRSNNNSMQGAFFGVPCVVADNFLKLASGDQIKVLLYILRCSDHEASIDEISANTGVPANAAEDALLFWKQVNVIGGNTPLPCKNEVTAPVLTASEEAQAPAPEQVRTIGQRPKQNLNPSQIAERISSSNDISELFKMTEQALGTLHHTMQNSLIWMHDYLGLRTEVIITLIYYCIKIGKTNSSYIEKIAVNWAENEINSLGAAEEEVQRLTQYHSFMGSIVKKFEMIRRPTEKQAKFIKQWKEEGFSLELIGFAYEKTIEQINKLSFEYINKILLSWKESGFTTVKHVRDAELQFRSSAETKPSKRRSQKIAENSDVEKYKVVINKF